MSAAQYELVEAAKKTIVTTSDGEIIRISEGAAIKAVLAGAQTVEATVSNALAIQVQAAV